MRVAHGTFVHLERALLHSWSSGWGENPRTWTRFKPGTFQFLDGSFTPRTPRSEEDLKLTSYQAPGKSVPFQLLWFICLETDMRKGLLNKRLQKFVWGCKKGKGGRVGSHSPLLFGFVGFYYFIYLVLQSFLVCHYQIFWCGWFVAFPSLHGPQR